MLFNENKENRIELYDAEKSNIINNIYVGRVRDVVANIGAAFVEIAPKVVCFFSLADNRNPIFLNRKNNNASRDARPDRGSALRKAHSGASSGRKSDVQNHRKIIFNDFPRNRVAFHF